MKKILLSLLLATSLVGCNATSSNKTSKEVTKTSEISANFGVPDEKTALFVGPDLFRKNIFIIFDMSGSMDERACSDRTVSKATAAKAALNKFIKNIPSNVAVGMLIFWDGDIHLVSKVAVDNRDLMLNAVNKVHAGGGTPLGESFDTAKVELTDVAKSQMGLGEYTIIAVTDGESNGNRPLDRAVNDIINMTPIQISTAGFCISERHALNQPGTTRYTNVGNEQSLYGALSATLAEDSTFKDQSIFK